MPAITPEIQAQLNHETDARFIAQTGVTRKLDPKNKLDQKLIPVWVHIYNDVKALWLAGTLVWTYQHPAVASAVTTATKAHAEAAAHLNDAKTAPTPAAKAASAQQAHAAMVTANQAAKDVHAAQHSLGVDKPIGLGHALANVANAVVNALTLGVSPPSSSYFAHQAPAKVVDDTSDLVTATQAVAAPAHAAEAAPAPGSPAAPSSSWHLGGGLVIAGLFVGGLVLATNHEHKRRRTGHLAHKRRSAHHRGAR